MSFLPYLFSGQSWEMEEKEKGNPLLKGKNHPEPSTYIGGKLFPPNSHHPLSASQECLGHCSQKQELSLLSTVHKYRCIWKEKSFFGGL